MVQAYQAAGLFERWPVRYLATQTDWISLPSKLLMALGALASFAGDLARRRALLLHAMMASDGSFWRKSLFVLLGRLARCPVIIHLHAADFMEFYHERLPSWGQAYARFILGLADRVVVLSPAWQRDINRIAPKARVVVLVNPMPMGAMPEDPGRQRDQATLLFLGRFGQRKGIFDLLQAVARLDGEFPDLQLLCGGDGDIEGVKNKAAELGISGRVKILGWVEGQEKERLLDQATICVLPSYAEGLPMVILEALAHGLPMITTPVGGIPDALQDGVEGLLVQPGDVAGLSQAIATLLRDPQLRETMARAGQKKAQERYAPERVQEQLDQIYRSVLPPGPWPGGAQ